MTSLYFGWGPALLGGLAGTFAMTVYWYALRQAGWLKLDWGQLLGTFTLPPGQRALALGLVWHFITGLLYGLIYAFLIASLGRAPGPTSGLALGLLHAALATGLAVVMPRVHPVLKQLDQLPWSGRDLALYGLGFVIFGGVFGTTYATYDTWVSAEGTGPVAFWMTAFTIFAVMLVIGLSRYILISREREEEAPIFAATHLSRGEQRAAIEQLYLRGDLTEAEYRAELADLESLDDR